MLVHSAHSKLAFEVVHKREVSSTSDRSICTKRIPLCRYTLARDVVLIIDFHRFRIGDNGHSLVVTGRKFLCHNTSIGIQLPITVV